MEARVNDLEARLKLNSTNSSKPPSSDPIGMKRKPPAPPSGKKRGGQPGHRKAHRPLVPPEKVRETFDCKPTACRRCGQGLSGDDPDPADPSGRRTAQDRADRRRVSAPSPDLPRLRRDDLRRLARGRPRRLLRAVPPGRAGHVRGGLPAQQAADPAGVRRPVRAVDLHRDDLQAGAAVGRRPGGPLQRTGGRGPLTPRRRTSTRRRGGRTGRKAWLWATVTRLVHGLHHRPQPQRRGRPRPCWGAKPDQVVGSDRFSAYEWIMARWRQICWAHLRRDFQAMIDRGGDGEADRRAVAVAVGPVVPPLAPGARRDPGVGVRSRSG